MCFLFWTIRPKMILLCILPNTVILLFVYFCYKIYYISNLPRLREIIILFGMQVEVRHKFNNIFKMILRVLNTILLNCNFRICRIMKNRRNYNLSFNKIYCLVNILILYRTFLVYKLMFLFVVFKVCSLLNLSRSTEVGNDFYFFSVSKIQPLLSCMARMMFKCNWR